MLNRESSKGAAPFIGTGQAGGVIACFSRDDPKLLKKVMRVLIMDSVSLFHVVVNPPLFLPIDDFGFLFEESTLKEQWKWLQNCLEAPRAFSIIEGMFEDFILMPEKTEKGNLHVHIICSLKPGRIYSDIPKIMWTLLKIQLKDFKSNERKAITEYCVNVSAVKDEGIIDYLFHKDKKDYETIYNLKDANGEFMFKPFMLSRRNVKKLVKAYSSDIDTESEVEEENTTQFNERVLTLVTEKREKQKKERQQRNSKNNTK